MPTAHRIKKAETIISSPQVQEIDHTKHSSKSFAKEISRGNFQRSSLRQKRIGSEALDDSVETAPSKPSVVFDTPTAESSKPTNTFPSKSAESANCKFSSGRWTRIEDLEFLRGCILLGIGEWKAIAETFVPTRTAVQIKSHAQKIKIHRPNLWAEILEMNQLGLTDTACLMNEIENLQQNLSDGKSCNEMSAESNSDTKMNKVKSRAQQKNRNHWCGLSLLESTTSEMNNKRAVQSDERMSSKRIKNDELELAGNLLHFAENLKDSRTLPNEKHDLNTAYHGGDLAARDETYENDTALGSSNTEINKSSCPFQRSHDSKHNMKSTKDVIPHHRLMAEYATAAAVSSKSGAESQGGYNFICSGDSQTSQQLAETKVQLPSQQEDQMSTACHAAKLKCSSFSESVNESNMDQDSIHPRRDSQICHPDDATLATASFSGKKVLENSVLENLRVILSSTLSHALPSMDREMSLLRAENESLKAKMIELESELLVEKAKTGFLQRELGLKGGRNHNE